MTAGGQPVERVRPTRADQEAFAQYQSTVLDRVLADARVWRNGYALLASAIGALITLIGTGLTETTHWGWRLALSLLLGAALVLIAIALWFTLTIEGGRRPATLRLDEIVQQHNSFELYQADQAEAAVQRLNQSRRYAIGAATACFSALIATLWVSIPPPDPGPAGIQTSTPSASPFAPATPTTVASPTSASPLPSSPPATP